jgi:hypothetical protein
MVTDIAYWGAGKSQKNQGSIYSRTASLACRHKVPQLECE